MAKPQRKFTYQPRDKDSVKERANARGGGFDSFILPKYKRYKMKDGKNLIRVLPPTWKGARHYGYDIWVNYGIGADNQSYLSLSKHLKGADPIAEGRAEANREGDEKLAKSLAPRQRVLMWVIDRLDEEEGPQLFDAPQTVDKALANLSMDEDTKEITLVDDPEEGCDFRFYKSGQGLLTDYDASKMKLMKPSPLCEDQKLQDEWLEYIAENPVPDTLQFYDYDHISAVFDGKGPAPADDEDKPKPRRRPAAADDEEEVPKPRRRQPEPDPEDEEEPPAEAKPRRRAAPVEDEDPPFDVDKPKPRRARAQVDDAEDEAEPELPLRSPARAKPKPAADDDEDITARLRRRRAAVAAPADDDDD